MWRSLLLLMVFASPALAQRQATAYEALKSVGGQLGRGALSQVVAVTGTGGDPQPRTWRVVVADRTQPAGVRELVVESGQVISSGPPNGPVGSSSTPATISTARLNLDSSGAFAVANHTADQSHTNFALVNYSLRTNDRGYPSWIVTLEDDTHRPVGTIHISANKGNVTRVEGLYAGANMSNVQQDPVSRNVAPQRSNDLADIGRGTEGDDEDSDVNPLKREIQKMFRQTKTDAQRIFGRVRRPFDDFINRR